MGRLFFIDGPPGTQKSRVAEILQQKYGFLFIRGAATRDETKVPELTHASQRLLTEAGLVGKSLLEVLSLPKQERMKAFSVMDQVAILQLKHAMRLVEKGHSVVVEKGPFWNWVNYNMRSTYGIDEEEKKWAAELRDRWSSMIRGEIITGPERWIRAVLSHASFIHCDAAPAVIVNRTHIPVAAIYQEQKSYKLAFGLLGPACASRTLNIDTGPIFQLDVVEGKIADFFRLVPVSSEGRPRLLER